ncbi:hypothetical protein [Krasilnikovia sp. MM14-A1004]|uniref:hypothetical protein n=1 Tax=Krasilnikovia sp. MM14-A1004 TaxID=3373541 RepID=UPI00399C6D00
MTVVEAMSPACTVLAVSEGDRPVGAYVLRDGVAVYRPVVDVTRLGVAALGTVAACVVAASAAAALRRRPAIGSLTMGPGGWVSLKRTGAPPLRPAGPRPWWARALRAHRLVVQP